MNANPYKTPAATSGESIPDKEQVDHPLAGCAAAFFLFAGVMGTLLGSSWIHTFGFTEYRAHLAYIGLPLGILTLLFSIVFIAFGVAIIRK